MKRLRHAWLLVGLCACGAEEPPRHQARFSTLTVVEGVPELPEAPSGIVIAATGVRSIAAGSAVIVGSDDGAFVVDEEAAALRELPIWSDAPDPPEATGAVERAVRFGDTVLVFADAGLFFSFGDKLLPSPDGEAVMDLGVRDVQPYGDELWIASDAGLVYLDGETLTAIDAAGGVPQLARRAGDVVIAVYDDRLYELDLSEGVAHEAPYDVGQVTALGPGVDGAVYLASDRGLFERAADGAYTHYPLDGRAVLALAYHAKDGSHALTADGVWAARPGQALAPVMRVEEPVSAFAADPLGRLWLAGDALVAHPVGTPVGFADDVAPLLESYCASCHAAGETGAPLVAFDDYEVVGAMATTIVERIKKGQMPPPGSPQPTASDVEILESWIASGSNP